MSAVDVATILNRSAKLKARAAAGEALGLVDTIDATRPMAQLIIPLADVLEARGRSTREALAMASQFVGRLTPESGTPLN
jgi:hypothetical protein